MNFSELPATPPWRPADEAEATSTMAAFIEWLRATGRCPTAAPPVVHAWAARDRPGFHATVAAFAGLSPGFGLRQVLPPGGRDALVIFGAAGRGQVWSRDAVRGGAALPSATQSAIGSLSPADLAALAASHLLGQEIRPDDCLHWQGDPASPWPYGAWIAGATVWLGPAPPRVGLRVFAAQPAGWADWPLRPLA